jgi:hypothetical protein
VTNARPCLGFNLYVLTVARSVEAYCHSLHRLLSPFHSALAIAKSIWRVIVQPMGLRVVVHVVLQSGWVGFVPRLVTFNICNNRGRACHCFEEAPAAHVPHDLPDRQVSVSREERILFTWLAFVFAGAGIRAV